MYAYMYIHVCVCVHVCVDEFHVTFQTDLIRIKRNCNHSL